MLRHHRAIAAGRVIGCSKARLHWHGHVLLVLWSARHCELRELLVRCLLKPRPHLALEDVLLLRTQALLGSQLRHRGLDQGVVRGCLLGQACRPWPESKTWRRPAR